MPVRDVKLGNHNEILNVPENREILDAIEKAPVLTPRQLLRAAKRYYSREATRQLAMHLAFNAMHRIVKEPAVKKAIKQIGKEQVPWSIFDDIWDAVSDFFVPDQPGPGAFPVSCEVKCESFLLGVLIEQCTYSDGSKDQWHIVGVCGGFSF
jgi:hypothetical protein